MSTEYASPADLAINEVEDSAEDVILPNGKKVRVRGLTRYELVLAGKGTEDNELIERRNLAMALVQPKMTEAQVEAFQRAAKGPTLKAITDKVRELSGLNEGAGKSDVDEVRD
ncbi:hypothetical protein [Micromonospora sp. CA-246542]|uniref:hypothetical protein n=1 Tax=Micromonospora sp. CA-246542 TaxID=3239959 RepID=UPI003D92E4F5